MREIKMRDRIEKNSTKILIGLLVLNFIIRLVIYFNTNLFYFSDFKAYFDGIEMIKVNGRIPLYVGEFSYLNSYIAYFFKYIVGSMHCYFIFNSLLGTLSTFVIYKIVNLLSSSRYIGLISIVLLSVYTEFIVWSSVFYTPITMIFFLSLFIYYALRLIKGIGRNPLNLIVLIIIFSLSLFFKKELMYVFFIFFVTSAFIWRKDLSKAITLILLSLVLFGGYRVFDNYVMKESSVYAREGTFLIFSGHTWYGGDGGKVTITYPEKRKLYDDRFSESCIKNNIENPSIVDEIHFKNTEVRRFIREEPFSWVYLQIHKLFWEYGILPEAVSFKVLMTGFTNGNTLLTALLLVLPIIIFILLFITTFNFTKFINAIKSKSEYQFVFLLFLYYILATVFYYAYQERYRMPVMACFIIPLLAYNLYHFNFKSFLKRRKEMVIKALIIMVFIISWGHEAYVIGVKNRGRYNKTMESINKFEETGDFEGRILFEDSILKE